TELSTKLAPTVKFYLLALRRGPAQLALRDVYLIGLAHVALLTRARAAIVVPDLHDETAARAFAFAHATLEHELEPFGQTAWLVFATIDRAAKENPELVLDEVDRGVVRRAHELRLELAAYAMPWRLQHELKRLAR
ncbi:MAG TPA: hypothetical protein VFQ65_19745, partial [Kofleriaceae bacterium]|nr:hypothetical protein [Kofleriaceae bacterium]